ncbi:MAG: HIT domain-containing protein [Nanoarchaeota archaeon]|mgnify:CR=1 FL=1
MPLTPEQISQLKNQLKEQIKHLPESQKEEAEEQIESMSAEAIESMLKEQQASQKPIFRAVVAGEIPSKKIAETKEALAVLDIKPISKGHIIIIPKQAAKNTKEIPVKLFTLAKKLAKKIESKLKAKSAEIQTESKFGEIIINVIPIYDKPLSINSPRTDASEKELEELESILKEKQKAKIIKLKKTPKKTSSLHKLKRRIP